MKILLCFAVIVAVSSLQAQAEAPAIPEEPPMPPMPTFPPQEGEAEADGCSVAEFRLLSTKIVAGVGSVCLECIKDNSEEPGECLVAKGPVVETCTVTELMSAKSGDLSKLSDNCFECAVLHKEDPSVCVKGADFCSACTAAEPFPPSEACFEAVGAALGEHCAACPAGAATPECAPCSLCTDPAIVSAATVTLACFDSIVNVRALQCNQGEGAPVVPVASLAPVAPAAPLAPVAPVAPLAPRAPVAPLAPVVPVASLAPVAPAAPLAPVAPVEGSTGSGGFSQGVGMGFGENLSTGHAFSKTKLDQNWKHSGAVAADEDLYNLHAAA